MPSSLLAPFVPLLSMVAGVSNPKPLPGSALDACSPSALALSGQFCLKLWLLLLHLSVFILPSTSRLLLLS